jgi:hypothetical protein
MRRRKRDDRGVFLIDQAIEAVKALEWPASRSRPTQLTLGLTTPNGSDHVVIVDAVDSCVHATAYARLTDASEPEPFPGERVTAVAELLNLIGATGVPVGFALDLDRRVIRIRNEVHVFPGTTDDPKPMLCDLITTVAGASVMYAPALRRVAFEGLAPDQVIAEVEEFIAMRQGR